MRLMVRGGCLPIRGSKGMEWKYDDDLSLSLCVCVTKETEIHVCDKINRDTCAF